MQCGAGSSDGQFLWPIFLLVFTAFPLPQLPLNCWSPSGLLGLNFLSPTPSGAVQQAFVSLSLSTGSGPANPHAALGKAALDPAAAHELGWSPLAPHHGFQLSVILPSLQTWRGLFLFLYKCQLLILSYQH